MILNIGYKYNRRYFRSVFMETNVKNREYSRYTQGGEVIKNPDGSIGWWERFDIPESEDDLLIEIIPRFSRRPDRLAYELYGKSELGWLVLQYNTILDIHEEFITGKIVRVPHPNRVTFNILNKSVGP